MRVFPHGNVVNFQASVREMFAADLERLLNRAAEATSVLTGTIDAEEGKLHLYGRIRDVEIDEQEDRFAIRFRDMENQADREAVRSFARFQSVTKRISTLRNPIGGPSVTRYIM